jgi:hypothetical protein
MPPQIVKKGSAEDRNRSSSEQKTRPDKQDKKPSKGWRKPAKHVVWHRVVAEAPPDAHFYKRLLDKRIAVLACDGTTFEGTLLWIGRYVMMLRTERDGKPCDMVLLKVGLSAVTPLEPFTLPDGIYRDTARPGEFIEGHA